jgi:1,4-dihydroxy-2-naphthoate polyprenyltransferase
LIAINNLRDREEDRTTEKLTLAVRFGVNFARVEIGFCCVAPYVIGLLCWPGLGLSQAAWWPLPASVLGIMISFGVVRNPPSSGFNRYLALGGAQLVLFTALFIWALR